MSEAVINNLTVAVVTMAFSIMDSGQEARAIENEAKEVWASVPRFRKVQYTAQYGTRAALLSKRLGINYNEVHAKPVDEARTYLMDKIQTAKVDALLDAIKLADDCLGAITKHYQDHDRLAQLWPADAATPDVIVMLTEKGHKNLADIAARAAVMPRPPAGPAQSPAGPAAG